MRPAPLGSGKNLVILFLVFFFIFLGLLLLCIALVLLPVFIQMPSCNRRAAVIRSGEVRLRQLRGNLLGSEEDSEPPVEGLRGCSLRYCRQCFDHARQIPKVLPPTAPRPPLHPACRPLRCPRCTSPEQTTAAFQPRLDPDLIRMFYPWRYVPLVEKSN